MQQGDDRGKRIYMKSIRLVIISVAIAMNACASESPNRRGKKRPVLAVGRSIGLADNSSEAEKWRNMFNSYIANQTRWSAIGMHDIVVRTGLDINARDETGKTPLQLAQELGNSIAVKYLLEKGAHDTNPARSAELLKSLESIGFERIDPVMIRSVNNQPLFLEPNTHTTTITTTTTTTAPGRASGATPEEQFRSPPAIQRDTALVIKLKESSDDDDDIK